MCTNCDQPTPCSNPCTSCGNCSCTCSNLYSTIGCLNIYPADCVQYLGNDIPCIGIKRKDTLTSVINSFTTYYTGLLGKITSGSLLLTRSGTCLDNLSIEAIPSTDQSNALTYGTDGRLYVPKGDINIVSTTCLSWQKTVSGSAITYVPVIDWNCVSQQTCPLCDNPAPCVAPTGLIVNNTGQTTAQVGWNSVSGTTYDALVNGVLQQAGVISPYTFNSLVANMTYSLTIRAKCASGLTADTPISVTTLPTTSCNLPSGIAIVISSGAASITWTPGGGGGTQTVEYKLLSDASYTQYAVVSPTTTSVSIPGLTQNATYIFRITNNCSGGTAAVATKQAIELTCVTTTTTVTDTSVVASFTPLGGAVTSYVVDLLNAGGTGVLQSQTFTGPFDAQVTATFTGLIAATTYNIRVSPAAGTVTRTNCGLTSFTTTSVPGCPLPTNLTVTIS